MLLKTKKNIFFWMCFEPVAAIKWGKGYVPLWQLFLRILYLFNSIFSEIGFGLINCLKEFISLRIVAMEIRKKEISQ